MHSCRWGTVFTDFWTTALCIWLSRWWRPVAYHRSQQSTSTPHGCVPRLQAELWPRVSSRICFIERECIVESLATLPSLTVNLVLITTILRSCLQTHALLYSFVALEEGKTWKTKVVIFRIRGVVHKTWSDQPLPSLALCIAQ